MLNLRLTDAPSLSTDYDARASASRTSPRRYWSALLAVTFVYYVAARFGLSLGLTTEHITSVWPPTGIALAACLLMGYRISPAIAIGAFLANLERNEPVYVAFVIAAGNTTEALAGAFLLNRFRFKPDLERVRDVINLALLGGLLCTIISASVGVMILWESGLLAGRSIGAAWGKWWLGDAMGALVIAPLLLTWGTRRPFAGLPRQAPEILSLTIGLAAVAWLMFGMPLNESSRFAYLLFPFFIWAALRFDQRITAALVLAVVALGIGSVIRAAEWDPAALDRQLILKQTFMGVLSVTALALGAAVAERGRSEAQRQELLLREHEARVRSQQLLHEVEQRQLVVVRTEQALRLSDGRLQLALDAGRMGIWEWDIKNQRIQWSENLERIHGREPGTFSGRFEDFRKEIHPDDIERVLGSIEQSLQERCLYHIEYRIIRPDGQTAWLEAYGRVIPDAANRPDRMVGVCMDVTNRKKIETELAAYQERLEELVVERTRALTASMEQLRRSERLASLGTLSAGIAHEINNPLNAIVLSADEALSAPDETQRLRTLQAIKNEALRGGRIVKSILDFSREQKTSKAPGDLNEVVGRAGDLARTCVERGDLSVTLDLDPGLRPVRINATEIEQVITNLIKNAAEAAGGRVDVVIQTRQEDGHVRLEVSDNGPGISQEHIGRIFDPFFSTRVHAGGTGLGLSICHSIITEHGGTIEVRSRPGAGAQFTVRLPVAAKADGPVADGRQVPEH